MFLFLIILVIPHDCESPPTANLSPAFSFVAVLTPMYVLSCEDKSKGNMDEECKHF